MVEAAQQGRKDLGDNGLVLGGVHVYLHDSLALNGQTEQPFDYVSCDTGGFRRSDQRIHREI